MNSIFSVPQEATPKSLLGLARIAILPFLVVLGIAGAAPALHPQGAGEAAAEFKQMSAELSAARLAGADESEAQMGRALAFLDTVAVSALNSTADPNLNTANQRLAGLVSPTPPVGENYRIVKLGGTPATYAMAVNFGLGGPAAVRLYAGVPGHYALAGRVDRFSQKDFFDSDIELVSASRSEPVFVTISGRTDDLSTGMFSAWRFDSHQVVELWSSDLLQQSSYEADENGFHLLYCSQINDEHPSQCLKMSRDLYRFQAGAWNRIETAEMPSHKPPVK